MKITIVGEDGKRLESPANKLVLLNALGNVNKAYPTHPLEIVGGGGVGQHNAHTAIDSVSRYTLQFRLTATAIGHGKESITDFDPAGFRRYSPHTDRRVGVSTCTHAYTLVLMEVYRRYPNTRVRSAGNLKYDNLDEFLRYVLVESVYGNEYAPCECSESLCWEIRQKVNLFDRQDRDGTLKAERSALDLLARVLEEPEFIVNKV